MPSKTDEEFYAREILKQIGYDEFELIVGERPDFHVTLDDRSVGIEVTEGAPESFIRGEKLRTTSGICTSGLRELDAQKKRISNEYLRRKVENSEWLNADRALTLWLDAMMEKIIKKTDNCTKDGYRIFDRNWLFIWNNMHDTFSENIDLIMEVFQNEAGELLADSTFDRVIIHSNWYLFNLQQDGAQVSLMNREKFNK